MSLVIQHETTEYVFVGISGTLPSGDCEMAFLPPAGRPLEADWEPAILVDDTNPLWEQAIATELIGSFYIACLVGEFDANTVILTPGDYQVWVRMTSPPERPVRIAPVALEVA